METNLSSRLEQYLATKGIDTRKLSKDLDLFGKNLPSVIQTLCSDITSKEGAIEAAHILGFNKSRDIYAPIIKNSLSIVLKPWIEASERNLEVSLPRLFVKEISSLSGLSISNIVQSMEAFPQEFKIILNGKTYLPIIEEGPYNIKRAIQRARYQSTKPGSKKVVKSGLKEKGISSKLQAGRLENRRIVFIPEEDFKGRPEKLENKVAQENLTTPPESNELAKKATNAYKLFNEMGPFYGTVPEPTFRISAEPVSLPENMLSEYTQIGKAIHTLSEAIKDLPPEIQQQYFKGRVFAPTPFTWRLDTIISGNEIFINEIETLDGADALMVAEQITYGLQTLDATTVKYYIEYFDQLFGQPQEGETRKLLFIRDLHDVPQYVANTERMIEYIEKLSGGKYNVILIDNSEIERINFDDYIGVWNLSVKITPDNLEDAGMKKPQLIQDGISSSLSNKAIFACIFDEDLESFWIENIGINNLNTLKKHLIPSSIIKTKPQLKNAVDDPKLVVKAYRAQDKQILGQGSSVFGNDLGKNAFKEALRLFQQGVKFISQEYIVPDKLNAWLKKGRTVEPVNWYNRICVKYVIDGTTPIITAAEATLGPNPKPMGRKCCFTAVSFSD